MRNNRVLEQQNIVILSEPIMLSQAEVSHALKTLDSVGLMNLENKKINKIAIGEIKNDEYREAMFGFLGYDDKETKEKNACASRSSTPHHGRLK